MLTTFFQARLVPYLQITTMGMKQDTLFEHKEFVVTCEEIMANAKEYKKLLQLPKIPKKTPSNTWNERMCSFYHKLGHLKEHCHWNPNNPNNKLKDKK